MTNKNNRIVGPILKNLVRQIAYLYERDIITILVSSGSAIAGKEVLGDCSAVDPTTRRQVFSSVGQPRLMRHYYSMFHDFGMRCAQVLATKRDFAPGVYRDNMVNCYEALLDEGIVPIANEDDAVSLTKSMFTDNDELASLVAELVDADMLIMLTDTDGLYTRSEEHTSELQSRPHLVCRLLLEKKKHIALRSFLFTTTRRPPRSTLFPYTTLFRSRHYWTKESYQLPMKTMPFHSPSLCLQTMMNWPA